MEQNKEEPKSVDAILAQAKQGLDNAYHFLSNDRPEPAKATLEEVSNDLTSISKLNTKLTSKQLTKCQEYSRIKNEYYVWANPEISIHKD